LLGPFLPFWFSIAYLMAIALYPVAGSFFIYRKLVA
jgi:hypothetical protein